MTEFPAHIHPNDPNIVQSCREHSRKVALYAGDVLKNIGLYHSAYLAGLVHDMGKFKDEFKDYLEKAIEGKKVQRGSVVHTFAGARYFLRMHNKEPDDFKDITCEILAYAVGAHHGLFDSVNENHENGFLHRLQTIPQGDCEAAENFVDQCSSFEKLDRLLVEAEDELTPILVKCNDLAKDDAESAFLCGLIVRLISSAVMEGDRRDTAEFMSEAQFPEKADCDLWQRLLEKTEANLNTFSSDTPINVSRKWISDICRDAAEKASGVYRLNIPTGGGKTLASLRYALAHAKKHGKKRIVFTSPLLSILDQNSKVIRDFIDEDPLVLEHHSNVLNEDYLVEDTERYALLADSWSPPVIITTLVQLLNTMFDGKTSSVRRFQALVDAVIVIDEVQTVPSKMLSLFNMAITFLAEICNTTIILCSATQPCFETITHSIRTEINDIVAYDPDIWSVFKRTQINLTNPTTMNEIPHLADEILQNTSSLLIVCNKKSDSERLFYALQNNNYELFHLSAAMCMEHRKQTLTNLYRSLNQGNRKTVCVATQVIEAGVDISFGAVIRLTAGLDSIIQSAGRCNRNGEADDLGQVYVVQATDEKMIHLHDIRLTQQATESLIEEYKRSPEKYDYDLSSDAAVRYYYKRLFNIQRQDNALYHDYPIDHRTTLFSLLSENRQWQGDNTNTSINFFFKQAFASAGKQFEVFDSDTTDVIVSWENGETIVSDLLSERAAHDLLYLKQLLKQARGYTVSLYSWQKRKLEEEGALIPLAGGVALGLDPKYYNNCTGLQINNVKEVNNECDTLIW